MNPAKSPYLILPMLKRHIFFKIIITELGNIRSLGCQQPLDGQVLNYIFICLDNSHSQFIWINDCPMSFRELPLPFGLFGRGYPLGLFGFGLPVGLYGFGWLLGGRIGVRLGFGIGFGFGCSSLLLASN